MRGRKPRKLSLDAPDRPILEQVARSRTLPHFQVQRAQIVLAVAEGQRTQEVARHMQCDRSTVWRLCRRYEQSGLEGLLSDEPRSGHPQEISPPAKSPDRQAGLPGADRHRTAYHPLDQRRSGPAGSC